MLKTILLPTDGTTHSDKTLEYALGLAKLGAANIVVFNAVEVQRLANRSVPGVLQSDKLTREEQSKKLVAKTVAKITKAGIAARGVVRFGSASKTILETATTEHAEIIVMGARNSKLGLGIGGTARRVVRDSTVPVLIVK